MPSPEGGPTHRALEKRLADRRILVGRFFHESHAFSPQITSGDQFEIKQGEDLITQARLSGTTLGGIVKRADEFGFEAVPTFSAAAPPGGLVDHGFYVEIRDRLLALAHQEKCD